MVTFKFLNGQSAYNETVFRKIIKHYKEVGLPVPPYVHKRHNMGNWVEVPTGLHSGLVDEYRYEQVLNHKDQKQLNAVKGLADIDKQFIMSCVRNQKAIMSTIIFDRNNNFLGMIIQYQTYAKLHSLYFGPEFIKCGIRVNSASPTLAKHRFVEYILESKLSSRK